MAMTEFKLILLAYHLAQGPTVAHVQMYQALNPNDQQTVQAYINGEKPLPLEVEQLLQDSANKPIEASAPTGETQM